MSKMDFAPSFKSIIVVCLLALILGCAEIGAPPGGEVDKTKPRIVESIPANQSVQVEPGNTIIIKFSERIDKPEKEGQIYISPRLSEEPKIDWKSDKVIITLPDSFAVEQTYIISFASGVMDLRRNPLDSGSIVAFTTGEKLADGMVKGQVLDINNQPQKNVITALFNTDLIQQRVPIDSQYPTYMSITDENGNFTFNYIPYGEYLPIAFIDKNKNDKLNSETELYGMPISSFYIDSTNNTISDLQLFITQHQESEQIIKSVRQTKDNIFVILLNNYSTQNNDSDIIKLRLINYIDSSASYNQKYILQNDQSIENTISAYFGDVAEGLYQLQMLLSESDTSLVFDSISVKTQVDNTPPSIQLFNPDIYPMFESELDLYIQFSEPIDTTKLSKETFYFLDSDSNLILPAYQFENQSFCRFTNSLLRRNINNYTLYISDFDIQDISGNIMGDSISFRNIYLVLEDSIGTARGKIDVSNISDSAEQKILQFKNIKTNQTFEYISNNNLFTIILPQGKYFLSSYVDINKNKVRDYGNISSFKYAEPFVLYKDTLIVRARFETTDIILEF